MATFHCDGSNDDLNETLNDTLNIDDSLSSNYHDNSSDSDNGDFNSSLGFPPVRSFDRIEAHTRSITQISLPFTAEESQEHDEDHVSHEYDLTIQGDNLKNIQPSLSRDRLIPHEPIEGMICIIHNDLNSEERSEEDRDKCWAPTTPPPASPFTSPKLPIVVQAADTTRAVMECNNTSPTPLVSSSSPLIMSTTASSFPFPGRLTLKIPLPTQDTSVTGPLTPATRAVNRVQNRQKKLEFDYPSNEHIISHTKSPEDLLYNSLPPISNVRIIRNPKKGFTQESYFYKFSVLICGWIACFVISLILSSSMYIVTFEEIFLLSRSTSTWFGSVLYTAFILAIAIAPWMMVYTGSYIALTLGLMMISVGCFLASLFLNFYAIMIVYGIFCGFGAGIAQVSVIDIVNQYFSLIPGDETPYNAQLDIFDDLHSKYLVKHDIERNNAIHHRNRIKKTSNAGDGPFSHHFSFQVTSSVFLTTLFSAYGFGHMIWSALINYLLQENRHYKQSFCYTGISSFCLSLIVIIFLKPRVYSLYTTHAILCDVLKTQVHKLVETLPAETRCFVRNHRLWVDSILPKQFQHKEFLNTFGLFTSISEIISPTVVIERNGIILQGSQTNINTANNSGSFDPHISPHTTASIIFLHALVFFLILILNIVCIGSLVAFIPNVYHSMETAHSFATFGDISIIMIIMGFVLLILVPWMNLLVNYVFSPYSACVLPSLTQLVAMILWYYCERSKVMFQVTAIFIGLSTAAYCVCIMTLMQLLTSAQHHSDHGKNHPFYFNPTHVISLPLALLFALAALPGALFTGPVMGAVWDLNGNANNPAFLQIGPVAVNNNYEKVLLAFIILSAFSCALGALLILVLIDRHHEEYIAQYKVYVDNLEKQRIKNNLAQYEQPAMKLMVHTARTRIGRGLVTYTDMHSAIMGSKNGFKARHENEEDGLVVIEGKHLSNHVEMLMNMRNVTIEECQYDYTSVFVIMDNIEDLCIQYAMALCSAELKKNRIPPKPTTTVNIDPIPPKFQ